MKKSLWLTLAVAAVAALFVVAGCAPAPPPDPTPDVTPTPAPTPAVDECPTDWITTTQIIYCDEDLGEYDGNFALRITFNKPIFVGNLSALQNPNNWTILVNRRVPYQFFDGSVWWSRTYVNNNMEPDILGAEMDGPKTVVVYLSLPDDGPASDPAITEDFFWCLICSSSDYNAWIAAANTAAQGVDDEYRIQGVADKYADVITWALDPSVLIYDELGNPCYDLCGISDEICCAIAPCPPVDAPCPI